MQFKGYLGYAAGKGKQVAKAELEKLNLGELDVLEAVMEAARIIYAAHDDSKDKMFELEISWISPQSLYRHEIIPASLLDEAVVYAKSRLSDMQD